MLFVREYIFYYKIFMRDTQTYQNNLDYIIMRKEIFKAKAVTIGHNARGRDAEKMKERRLFFHEIID